MDAAVIELDPLPDPVRPSTQDHDLFPVCRRSLALFFIGGIHVGGVGDELGGAGIDPLVDGPDAEFPAQFTDFIFTGSP